MDEKTLVVMFDMGGVLTIGGEKGTNETAATKGLGLGETIHVPDLLEALKRGKSITSNLSTK